MAIHVLWADDEEYEHALMERVIAHCAGRLTLATCRSGREAVALATGKLGMCVPLDLAIIDVRMPDMDGFDVIAELKKDPSSRLLPIIAYSADRRREDVLRAYELGVTAYVVKPREFDGACEFFGLLEKLWANYVTTPRAA